MFLTPLVVTLCKRANLPIGPYLVALATSANIGSAATLIGNPQNILIGSLSGIGFKVLVDILATARRPVRVGEVGYRFRQRARGTSKLDIVVELEYLELLFDKVTGGWIPPSYFLFGLVGAVGMAFNFVAAAVLLRGFGLEFVEAQAAGALLTVAVNFFLNNVITFRARRMRGTRWKVA